MHVDDVRDDFSPDLDILAKASSARAHPAECACPACVTVDESKFDNEGQPIAPDPETVDFEAGHVFPVADIAGKDDEEAEVDSITFEDRLAAEAASEHDESAETAADADESEADPDAPLQMNLF